MAKDKGGLVRYREHRAICGMREQLAELAEAESPPVRRLEHVPFEHCGRPRDVEVKVVAIAAE